MNNTDSNKSSDNPPSEDSSNVQPIAMSPTETPKMSPGPVKINNNQVSAEPCCQNRPTICPTPDSISLGLSNGVSACLCIESNQRTNLNQLSNVSNNLGSAESSHMNISNPSSSRRIADEGTRNISDPAGVGRNISYPSSSRNEGSKDCVSSEDRNPSTERTAPSTRNRTYSDSSSENEGEDCCVYTYKGTLQADLPHSFLTLDRIANGLDNPVEERGGNRRSGSSSPDNDFLEMDFDPGPSLDMDESEEQEMRGSPVSDLPSEQQADENDLSAETENVEREEIVANVEPQPGPSRRDIPDVIATPLRPVLPLATTFCPTALPNRNWSARDAVGHHCSSGDLCSPSSGGEDSPESLSVWSSGCGRTEGDGKHNLFSDLYHSIMAKRLVMEKNASFTDLKADADDSSTEQPMSPPVGRTMVWSEQEACAKQVTQISTSACGATAVINAMMALNCPFSLDKVKKGVSTRLRAETAPLPQYLVSRSAAGATHDDIIRGIQTASDGSLYARFFHMHPERRFGLSKWLSNWLSQGAVAIATLNLQAGLPPGATVPDAWHHQMIFGVSPRGIFLTNPLECVPESDLLPQLCSPSVLKVKRSDVIQRWSASTDLMSFFRPEDVRWKELNVLGQVVNVVRESMGGGGQRGRSLTQHITIPAAYKSGVTLIAPVDTPVCKLLEEAPELPLTTQALGH